MDVSSATRYILKGCNTLQIWKEWLVASKNHRYVVPHNSQLMEDREPAGTWPTSPSVARYVRRYYMVEFNFLSAEAKELYSRPAAEIK